MGKDNDDNMRAYSRQRLAPLKATRKGSFFFGKSRDGLTEATVTAVHAAVLVQYIISCIDRSI